VVCALAETIATFWPTSALTRVDLPALGRRSRRPGRKTALRRIGGVVTVSIMKTKMNLIAPGGKRRCFKWE
jgi:hypothetical protein